MSGFLASLATIFKNEIMIVFAIAALGYLLGSAKVKGLSLGVLTSGTSACQRD